VYFEGHKRLQGYIHCKGLNEVESYKLSKLFSTGARWLSQMAERLEILKPIPEFRRPKLSYGIRITQFG